MLDSSNNPMPKAAQTADAIADLEARMAAATPKPIDAGPEADLDPRDFAEEIEATPLDNPETAAPEGFTEYVPPEVGIGLLASATGIVKSLSVLMGFFGRKLYAKAILEPQDAEIISAVQTKAEAAPAGRQSDVFNNLINENPQAQGAYARSLKFTEAIKALPLSDEEQEMLQRPIANLMGHYQVQPGPWGDLVIVLLIIMLPRLEPILPNGGQILQSLAGNE